MRRKTTKPPNPPTLSDQTRPECVQDFSVAPPPSPSIQTLLSDSERQTTNFSWSIFVELIRRVYPPPSERGGRGDEGVVEEEEGVEGVGVCEGRGLGGGL